MTVTRTSVLRYAARGCLPTVRQGSPLARVGGGLYPLTPLRGILAITAKLQFSSVGIRRGGQEQKGVGACGKEG